MIVFIDQYSNIVLISQTYISKLKYLSLQSLLRLKEPAVLLRCRKDDAHLVESALESAKEDYAAKANVHPPDIIIDHKVYLPPAPSHHHAHGPSW